MTQLLPIPKVRFQDLTSHKSEDEIFLQVEKWLIDIGFVSNTPGEVTIVARQYPLWLWDSVVLHLSRNLEKKNHIVNPPGWILRVSSRIYAREVHKRHS